MTGRAILAGLAIAAAIATGCYRAGYNRHVTGTCRGACDWYMQCKRSDDTSLRRQCLAECPQVFGDERSLEAFESMSCRNAIEYVEGAPSTVARHR